MQAQSPYDYMQQGGKQELLICPCYNANELWQECKQYFDFIGTRHWDRYQVISNKELDHTVINIPASCPMSLQSFLIFTGLTRKRWQEMKASEDESLQYICEQAELAIETHLFEGGLLGAFNANLVSRSIGLTDKSAEDNSVNINQQITGLEVI